MHSSSSSASDIRTILGYSLVQSPNFGAALDNYEASLPSQRPQGLMAHPSIILGNMRTRIRPSPIDHRGHEKLG
ncbi:hypothetical protein FRC18_008011, partial [Serendipita sp. 400]